VIDPVHLLVGELQHLLVTDILYAVLKSHKLIRTRSYYPFWRDLGLPLGR
jgi:hypothetical protein